MADRLLSVLAAAGASVLVVLLLGPLAGVHAYVVRSGSMAPTFGTGSLVVTHRVPAGRLRLGDVVSVSSPGGSRVTHRLVGRGPQGLVLRGDANRAVDPERYAVTAADRVVWALPVAGYAVAFLASPLGMLLAAATVVGCALLASPRRTGQPRRPGVAKVTAGLLAVVTLSVLWPGAVRPSYAAAWTDPVTVSGSSYTAATVGAPTVSCGTLLVLNTTLTWTAVPGATGYRLHEGLNGATSETVSSSVTSKSFTSVQSGTFWVEALQAYGATTWVSAISNKKAYTVLLTLAGTCLDA